jgi:galactose mutarotase-like enzyme
MFIIKSNHFKVYINPLGAELQQFTHITHGNLLWQKNDKLWNRFAPILFPIVGRLLNDQYTLNHESYGMRQHGFARDQVFQVIDHSEDSITLRLTDNEQTRLQYPFAFELQVKYTLFQDTLDIEHCVTNLDSAELYYSIGGHPGFHIEGKLSEYYLDFGSDYSVQQHLITGNYYNGKTKEIQLSRKFELSDDLFTSDAIVIKQPPFQSIGFGKIHGPRILSLHCDTWTAVGLWTKPGAPFFCIEPWWGWADALDSSGNIKEKEGIISLASGSHSTHRYKITIHS